MSDGRQSRRRSRVATVSGRRGRGVAALKHGAERGRPGTAAATARRYSAPGEQPTPATVCIFYVKLSTGPGVGPDEVFRPSAGINYERLYKYRFRDVDQAGRQAVWGRSRGTCTPGWAHRSACSTRRPAAASSSAPSRGRALGRRPGQAGRTFEAAGVKMIISDIMDADLPEDYFDGVLISNFLEHLPDQNAVADVLGKLRAAMTPGGRIAIMGPNFRYCAEGVLRLRRPHGDPHPRRRRRAPVRRRVRGRVGGARGSCRSPSAACCRRRPG